LLCKGERWRAAPALADPAVRDRVEVISGGGNERDQRHLIAALRAADPDVIHFHSIAAMRQASDLFEGRGIVVSPRLDGADLIPTPPADVWAGGDAFLFLDEAALERAVAAGCPRERSEILDPPVWGASAAPGPAEDAEGPLRVLAWGPLTWERGLEYAVHAIRIAEDRGIRCELRVLGGGEHLIAVGFARHQLALHQQVEILIGNRGGSLAEELARAQVLLDAAVTDTTSPAALIAAQAAGIPYVATSRDCLIEGAGLVVPRRDPGSIADALAQLADPRRRAELGAVARDSTRERTNRALAANVERLRELYAGAGRARAAAAG
jgi:glycosyltransferase involved in cell wall biosynthesis